MLCEYFVIMLFLKMTSREVSYTISIRYRHPTYPLQPKETGTAHWGHFLATFSLVPQGKGQQNHRFINKQPSCVFTEPSCSTLETDSELGAIISLKDKMRLKQALKSKSHWLWRCVHGVGYKLEDREGGENPSKLLTEGWPGGLPFLASASSRDVRVSLAKTPQRAFQND